MKCVICGKEVKKSLYMNKVLCSDECFYIDYWNDCLNDTAIIIDGECYHDGGSKPKNYDSRMLGFAGRVFYIQMNDGTYIETNNLYYNGVVPKDRNIKDNAQFLSKPLNKKGENMNNITIEDLDLSVVSYNCCKRAGYNYLSDFEGKSKYDLMKIRNLRPKAMEEIIQICEKYGIKIKEDE